MLGVHVNKVSSVVDEKESSELEDAIIRDLTPYGLNSAQIFTYGPKFFVKNNYNGKAIKKVTKNKHLSVHSAYPTTRMWKNADEKSKKYIDDQMISCKDVGADYLVIHITKVFADDASEIMTTMVKPLAKKNKVVAVLEMVASKADPDTTYETPEKLDNLTTLIGAKEKWWGWCVDTAHIWAAGVDVKSYKNMKSWLDRLTYKDKILMFHLNGSHEVLGGGKDKHAIPFAPEDNIWSDVEPKESGVRAIVEFAVERDIPIICEINRGTSDWCKKSLGIIRDMILELSEK